MTDYDESYDIVDSWLATTFAADATLTGIVGSRIAAGLSGLELDTPYLTWDVEDFRSVRGVGGALLDANGIVVVKAVAQGTSYGVASSIRARVKGLLDDKNVTLASPPAHVTSHWETNFRYSEVHEGVPYRHVVARYRMHAVFL